MSESEYPIPVEHLDSYKAQRLGCEGCGYERAATEDEITGYSEPESFVFCPECKHGLTWKYAEADPCRNCGKLGWFSDYPEGCCSRACVLQLEYRKERGKL